MSTETPSAATVSPKETGVANTSGEMVVGFAVLGCLAVGLMGIFRALTVTTGLDVFFCLMASTAAFSAVLFFSFHHKS